MQNCNKMKGNNSRHSNAKQQGKAGAKLAQKCHCSDDGVNSNHSATIATTNELEIFHPHNKIAKVIMKIGGNKQKKSTKAQIISENLKDIVVKNNGRPRSRSVSQSNATKCLYNPVTPQAKKKRGTSNTVSYSQPFQSTDDVVKVLPEHHVDVSVDEDEELEFLGDSLDSMDSNTQGIDPEEPFQDSDSELKTPCDMIGNSANNTDFDKFRRNPAFKKYLQKRIS